MLSLPTHRAGPQAADESWRRVNKLPIPHRGLSGVSQQHGAQLPPIANVPRVALPDLNYPPNGAAQHSRALTQKEGLVAYANDGHSEFESWSGVGTKTGINRVDQKCTPHAVCVHLGLPPGVDGQSQQAMSEAQLTVGPSRTQTYGAIVHRQDSYNHGKVPKAAPKKVTEVEESLEFVTFNGPPVRNDPASRKKIKAHVMRQVHQQRRTAKMAQQQAKMLPAQPIQPYVSNGRTFSYANSKALQLSSHVCGLSPKAAAGTVVKTAPGSNNHSWSTGFSVNVLCETCGKIEIFRCQASEALTYRPYTASPRDGPGESMLNPFAPSPVKVTHFMHELVHHFVHVHLPTSSPEIYGEGNLLSPTIYLVDLAVTDPAAVYAMVVQAAYHRAALIARTKNIEQQKRTVMQATFFLSEALRLLQEKLDDARSALSNVAIFITAMLASSMGILADKNQLKAHYHGMMRMVELRGGIDTLPRIVASQVSRIDSNASWVSRTAPMCPMYKSRFRDRSSHPLIFGIVGSSNPFPNTKLREFCCKPLFSIACDLLYLTKLLYLHRLEPEKVGLNEREYFEDNFAACQLGLASYPRLHTITAKSITIYRQECFRLAMFIYFNTGIRISPSPALIKTMTGPLIEAFQESDLPSFWHPYTHILLWILVMGYCGSWDPIEKGWFVQECRRVVNYLKIESVQDLESVMFLYHKNLNQRSLYTLWETLSRP